MYVYIYKLCRPCNLQTASDYGEEKLTAFNFRLLGIGIYILPIGGSKLINVL